MCVRSVFGIALVGPPELAGNMLSFILFGSVPSQSASRDLQGRKPPGGAAVLRGTSSFVSVDLRLTVFVVRLGLASNAPHTYLQSDREMPICLWGGVWGRRAVSMHSVRTRHQSSEASMKTRRTFMFGECMRDVWAPWHTCGRCHGGSRKS